MNTFLIGLLDGDFDVGEVDAMLSLFKQPNSMPTTDLTIAFSYTHSISCSRNGTAVRDYAS